MHMLVIYNRTLYGVPGLSCSRADPELIAWCISANPLSYGSCSCPALARGGWSAVPRLVQGTY
jgi:hypothetical protein